MTHQQKLMAYQSDLLRWHKAQSDNNPMVHRPTRKEFGLAPDDWGAREVEKQVMREVDKPGVGR